MLFYVMVYVAELSNTNVQQVFCPMERSVPQCPTNLNQQYFGFYNNITLSQYYLLIALIV